MEGEGFTILHRDEFERTGRWLLARRSLGISSFGLNMVEMEPGYSIPEHDETGRDHEEVYIVWSGNVTAVIDGNEYPAPAGTFVRVDPHPRRTLRNDGEETATLLMVSAPRTSGFEPLDWA
jgi:mannose-6-phosphate isomerase-like protein (cupin superfamily)